VLLFTKFDKNRIITVASNLLKEISEIKRDGGSMLVALSTRVCFSNRLSTGCNDLEISVFKQEAFLKNILCLCKSSPNQVITHLNELRRCILQSNGPGFAQFTVPLLFTESDSKKVVDFCLDIWRSALEAFPKSSSRAQVDSFPFPRRPFQRDDVHESFSSSILVPISGLGASFLFQVVPCDVINSPDYLPLSLLVEILSRCEGALYSSIRGQGYAYGAHLSIVLWTGQLCFELMDASDPVNGLLSFYSILDSLKHDFSTICSQYELETARASLAYRFVSERATGSGIISQSLRSALRGTDFLEVDSNLINLKKVTVSDLQRVFSLYLTRFLDSSQRITFITTSDGEKGANIHKSFLDNGLPISLSPLKDFDIQLN
jgi:Zn-dependent M16 (insulinase) family peptidase